MQFHFNILWRPRGWTPGSPQRIVGLVQGDSDRHCMGMCVFYSCVWLRGAASIGAATGRGHGGGSGAPLNLWDCAMGVGVAGTSDPLGVGFVVTTAPGSPQRIVGLVQVEVSDRRCIGMCVFYLCVWLRGWGYLLFYCAFICWVELSYHHYPECHVRWLRMSFLSCIIWSLIKAVRSRAVYGTWSCISV